MPRRSRPALDQALTSAAAQPPPVDARWRCHTPRSPSRHHGPHHARALGAPAAPARADDPPAPHPGEPHQPDRCPPTQPARSTATPARPRPTATGPSCAYTRIPPAAPPPPRDATAAPTRRAPAADSCDGDRLPTESARSALPPRGRPRDAPPGSSTGRGADRLHPATHRRSPADPRSPTGQDHRARHEPAPGSTHPITQQTLSQCSLRHTEVSSPLTGDITRTGSSGRGPLPRRPRCPEPSAGPARRPTRRWRDYRRPDTRPGYAGDVCDRTASGCHRVVGQVAPKPHPEPRCDRPCWWRAAPRSPGPR